MLVCLHGLKHPLYWLHTSFLFGAPHHSSSTSHWSGLSNHNLTRLLWLLLPRFHHLLRLARRGSGGRTCLGRRPLITWGGHISSSIWSIWLYRTTSMPSGSQRLRKGAHWHRAVGVVLAVALLLAQPHAPRASSGRLRTICFSFTGPTRALSGWPERFLDGT